MKMTRVAFLTEYSFTVKPALLDCINADFGIMCFCSCNKNPFVHDHYANPYIQKSGHGNQLSTQYQLEFYVSNNIDQALRL